MAKQERNLIPRDVAHEKLMRSILKGIKDTPLVLKGGTALLLAYGLDRFSEDLDFDAPLKLNLESRIRRNVPHGIALVGIDSLKDTATVTRYRVRYQSEHGPRSLKLEISYRTPAPESDVRTMLGLRVASLPRIIDQKLNAAHDGDDPRSKVRDLYDLDYISRNFPAVFTEQLASRLLTYSTDPDSLISRYRADFEEDDLIIDLVELEQLALGLHYSAVEICQNIKEVARRITELPKLKMMAGADYTFWRNADKAIKAKEDSGGGSREVDWKGVEEATISESIGEHGQSPDSVLDALCKYSPGAVSLIQQETIAQRIQECASQLQAAYKHLQELEEKKNRDLDPTG